MDEIIFQLMQAESEPQHGKTVLLPEIGIETQLPPNFDLVIRGEVPSLYERTRELRGVGPSKKADTMIFEKPKVRTPESESFILRMIDLIERARAAVERRLDNAVDAMQDYFDPFSDADQNTAHGFIYKTPDGRTIHEIAYSTGLDSNMKLFAIGHEYGELLQNIENQKDLQKALDAEGIAIDVTHYWGEPFADLVGFLTLYRAKKAGDDTIRIPFFRTDIENREKMGRLFGLEPSIGPKPKPRGWGV